MNLVIYSGLLVMILAYIIAALVASRSQRPQAAVRAVVGSMLSINSLIIAICAALMFSLGNPMTVLAEGTAAAAASNAPLGAALATGLACIGAGIAVGIAGAAAIGGITEKPEILGRTLIFVGLAEGIAIYGLIISFMILNA